ncbi:hypothetical protein PUNSTDRAFT_145229 [Punctularia strigosozonata HHB-11173 SS5]|uniref:uncharacterized protein n=1 Tax=Punctularia strigosozonata (strain HHB-11173) TaxID=741275 RepID=UPI00044186FF|nr:uncharacterized protein PUNSTDRAFT_145229 [Punctularia strigosozonata HHB-11173 SS5]EIN06716.1 hypothetical protein PUNSTDRAFT_145229 [Punctularia strigosozonata HHB-11173 SS5]
MSLPTSHRALKLISRDQPLSLQTVPTPQAGPGSVVVRVLAANVISYAKEVYTGVRPYPFPTPFTHGSSSIARVVACGPDATSLKPGQLVLFECTIRGRDDPTAACLSGLAEGFTEGGAALMRGEWRDSTYAEYAKCPLENCVPLDEGRLLGSPGAGGLGYAVEDLAHLATLSVPFGGLDDVGLKAGETVAIAPATGHFGGAAVRVALAMGARVIAMGRNADALAHLEALDPSRVSTVRLTNDLDADLGALKAAARGPVDVFFDISPPMAAKSTHVRAGIAALRYGGRVSLMGGVFGDVAFDYISFMHRNLTLKGTWMYTREQLQQLLKMVETGVLSIGPGAGIQVVGKYGLEESAQALDAAAANAASGKDQPLSRQSVPTPQAGSDSVVVRVLAAADGLGSSVEELVYIATLAVPFGGLDYVGLKAGETVVIAPATGNYVGAAVHLQETARVAAVRITNDLNIDPAALKTAARGPVHVFFDISPQMAAHSTHVKTGIAALGYGGSSFLKPSGGHDPASMPYRYDHQLSNADMSWLHLAPSQSPSLHQHVRTPSEAADSAGAQAVNRSALAALVFLVWDILITMDDEIKFMWFKNWSYTKALYFFVRYFAVMVQVSTLLVGTELTPQFHFTSHDCFIWQVWQGAAAIALEMAVDIVLILRLYAMYGRNRTVGIVIVAAFVVEVIGMAVSLALALPLITYDHICTVTSAPPALAIYAGFAIIYQGILFGFTAVQFVKSVRTGWGRTRVLTILIRDGTWAFFLIFFIMLLQVMLYAVPDHGPYTGIFFGWLLTSFSFCGYRLLINVQSLALQHSRSHLGSSSAFTSRVTSTHMEFASHGRPLPRGEDTSVSGEQIEEGYIEELDTPEEFELRAPPASLQGQSQDELNVQVERSRSCETSKDHQHHEEV